MKKFISILLIFGAIISYAQQVSDYKYVIIPEAFTDFKKNQYNLNSYLKNLLDKKGYVVILENIDEMPAEVSANPCLALRADAVKIKSMLNNKLKVVFADCKKNTVEEFEGTSRIKEIDRGNIDAMKIAINNLKKSKPKNIEITSTPETFTSTSTPITTDKKIFTNNDTKVTISELKDGSFLLINEDSAQIVAQFYPSTLPKVYHVKVLNKGNEYFTIGHFDGNQIMIEFLNEQKQWVPTHYK